MLSFYFYYNLNELEFITDVSGDLILFVSNTPIISTSSLLRFSWYYESTPKWLLSTLESSDKKRMIKPSKYYELEAWLLLDKFPVGLSFSLPESGKYFPLETSLKTYFTF